MGGQNFDKYHPGLRGPWSAYDLLNPGTPSFDPGSLNLTGWWKNYTGASPWVGTASAGTSGSNNLTEATNPPTNGTPIVAGIGTAKFNGTNQQFNGAALSTFYTASAYSGFALVNTDNITVANLADPGNSNQAIVCSFGTGAHAVRLSSTGPAVTHFLLNNLAGNASAQTPISILNYRLVQWRYNGTNIMVKVDSGAWVSNVAGGASAFSLAANLGVAQNVAANAWFSGSMSELGLSPVVLSDADFDNIRTNYINKLYRLAL